MYPVIALGILLAAGPQEPTDAAGPPKLVLYAQTALSGDSRSILAGFPNLGDIDFDNKARSVRVIAGRWEICAEKRYRECQVVDANVPDLDAIGLSRKISSVRLAPGGATTRAPIPPPPPIDDGSEPHIVFFDKTGFRGGTLELAAARGNLAGLTARAESIRVMAGTWQLCTGMNYTGTCTTIDADRADLGPWRNRIVSARPVTPGAPPPR
jgi:hypothetical protein